MKLGALWMQIVERASFTGTHSTSGCFGLAPQSGQLRCNVVREVHGCCILR